MFGKKFGFGSILRLFRSAFTPGQTGPRFWLPDSGLALLERIEWKPVWTREAFFDRTPEEVRLLGLKPDDLLIVPGNLLLNGGITVLQKLLIGATATPYNAAGAYIAVGNGNTAESAAQTDLQGASKQRNGMDATFPSVSGQTASWKSTYATSEANFNWLEVGVQNATGTPDGTTIVMLNRKQQDFGTKVSGSTWTMTLSLTIS